MGVLIALQSVTAFAGYLCHHQLLCTSAPISIPLPLTSGLQFPETPCGCLGELMERTDVRYKVSPRTADTCFDLSGGPGVPADRFVFDGALMRRGCQQTQALSKSVCE